jgi:hypothetical protein
MSTHLAAVPVDANQLDLLALVADNSTPLGRLHDLDFHAACIEDGRAHDGYVSTSRVSAILHRRLRDFNPRSLSAKWSGACGPDGFLDKTDIDDPIDPTHSRGNGNKSTKLRRLRGWSP